METTTLQRRQFKRNVHKCDNIIMRFNESLGVRFSCASSPVYSKRLHLRHHNAFNDSLRVRFSYHEFERTFTCTICTTSQFCLFKGEHLRARFSYHPFDRAFTFAIFLYDFEVGRALNFPRPHYKVYSSDLATNLLLQNRIEQFQSHQNGNA